MRQSDVFPSQWLSAADIEGPTTVTIEGVTLVEVGRDKEMKPALHVKEFEKPLILNKTNWTNLVNLTHEDDSDNWRGQQVQLYATKVQFGGEEVDAVRIRMVKATAPAKPNGNSISAAAQQAWGKFYSSLTPEEREQVTVILEGEKPSAWMTKLGRTVEQCIEFVKAGLTAPADPANF